ncbi:methyl-accepting chemotaxis protein [Streptomyces ficellus]|uniref:Methyl-accepting chemotaxis protein n=1 Tax=Streptomyces ficellus TaxID=1977088 RepID=A0A6I6F8K1_9ACTN|nr:methyl-accepting chemotaxis protein [Streptomyces ficellus]QGV80283.1 methyl-accepting chemotaxis protein [Streptomyces ficellus]
MPVGALAERHVVAQQLRDVAERPELASRRDELTSLADALQGIGDGDVEPWTELDLLHAYARPESITPAGPAAGPERPYWAWLEAGLGALVFVPLLLTWYGLTKASSAYGTLIGTDPKAAGRPFLQLWQSGFEGRLTGWFTFGHVAGTATGAILLLLVLALAHGFRRAAVERREDAARRTGDELLARLVPLLTRAQLLLNDVRLTSPQRFTAELTGAASTLRRLGDRAVKAHKELTAAASTVGDAVESAERRLSSVDGAVRPLEESAADIGKAVVSLTDRVEAAVSGSGTAVRDALEEVRAASGDVRDVLGRAGERVEDSVHTLAAAQRAFTTGAEVSADVSARVLDRLAEVVEETARAVAGSQETMRRLDDRTRALGDAAARFAELAAELRRTPVREPSSVPGPAPAPAPAPGPAPGPAAERVRGHEEDERDAGSAVSLTKSAGARGEGDGGSGAGSDPATWADAR